MSKLYDRNGVFYISVPLIRADGKRFYHRQSTGYTSLQDAEKQREKIAYQIKIEHENSGGSVPIIGLKAAIDLFLQESVSKGKSSKTVETYRHVSRKFIGDVKKSIFHFDRDRYLHTIRTRDLAEYHAKRLEEGLKSASIALELKIFMAVHNACKRAEYKINPNLMVSLPRPASKTRIFTPAEISKILAQSQAVDIRAYHLFKILLSTGCRISEILRSQSGDYNLAHQIFTVHRSKTQTQTQLYLPADITEILSRYVTRPEPFSGFSSVVILLRHVISGICNTSDSANLIARSGKATIHTCRHTFATNAIMAGAQLYEVSKILGHTTTTMTAKYSHLDSLSASRSVHAKIAHTSHRSLN